MNQKEILVPCGTSVVIRCEAPKNNNKKVLATMENSNNESTVLNKPNTSKTNNNNTVPATRENSNNERAQTNASNIPGVVPLNQPGLGNTVEKTNIPNNNTNKNNKNKKNKNKNKNKNAASGEQPAPSPARAAVGNIFNTAPIANVAPTTVPAPAAAAINNTNGLKRKRNNNNKNSTNKTKKAKRN